MRLSGATGISRDALERETAKSIVDFALIHAYDVRNRPKAYPVVRGGISGYHDETLYRLKRAARSSQAYNIFIMVTNRESEQRVNDTCMLTSVATALKINDKSVYRYINALSGYANLAPQQNGHYPAKRFAQASALMRVTHLLYLRNVGVLEVAERVEDCIFRIKDENLSDLILASEDPESIADLMDRRSFTTVVEVATFLDAANGVPESLRTGAL